MKSRIFLFNCICLLFGMYTQAVASESKEGLWWNNPYPKTFDSKKLINKQEFVRVKGNRLVLDSGKNIDLKGMNIADPDKLARENQWNERLFIELKNWGANVVRLPIHPISWNGLGKERYFELLDQAVLWANKHHMYLIVDWHSIGYLPSGLFQHVIYETNEQETRKFWRDIAFRYQNISTIAVYELFNEPTDQGGRAGKANWQEWKRFNEELIDIIYAHDTNVIPLVAGFNWAYDLRPVKNAPIERKGIAYAVHPYPQKAKPEIKSKENFFKLWEEVWGFLAKDYPVMATELGWVQPDGYGAHIPVMNDGSYGPQIIEFMDKRNISWTGWVFDPQWSPTMIKDWSFEPTEQGAFFKKVLQNQ